MLKNKREKLWVLMLNGGSGKRLLPYTEGTSKGLVPLLNNFPITEFILYSLSKDLGLRKFIFSAKGLINYSNLQSYYQGGSGWSAKLNIKPQVEFEYQDPKYNDEGSADGLKHNIDKFKINSPILVIPNDDIFHPIDIKKLVLTAEKSDKPFIMGLTHVNEIEHFGIAQLAKDSHTINNFVEKPKKRSIESNLANTGIYLVKPEAFKYLNKDFGRDTIPQLVKDKMIGSYIFKHKWLDFGNPAFHLESTLFLLENPYPYFKDFIQRTYEKVRGYDVWIRGKGKHSEHYRDEIINKIKTGKVTIQGKVYIGKECYIGDNALLSNCSIGDLCHVGEHTKIIESNIFDVCFTSNKVRINKSIIGRGTMIMNNTRINKSYIGNLVCIQNDCYIHSSKVTNSSEIETSKTLKGVNYP